MRSLAVRVEPAFRESFDSLIARTAFKVHVPRKALMTHIGLSPAQVNQSVSYGLRIPDDLLEELAVVFGITPVVLRDTTMDTQNYRTLRLTGDGRKISTSHLWGQTLTTRICPDCVDEDAGARQTSWRLVWYFACLRHRRLLLDLCPDCQNFITALPRGPSETRAPWTCGVKVPKVDHTCSYDLRTADTEQLEADHPVLQTQMHIAALVEGARTDQEVFDFFMDLRAVSVGVLGLDDETRMARIADLAASDLVGLGPQLLKSPTKTAPRDSLYMAATCTWALDILDPQTGFAPPTKLTPLVDKARSKSRKADAALLTETFGEATERLTKALVTSADDTITYRDRLLLYSASNGSSGRQADRQTIAHRATQLPQAMWPTWTILLAGNRSDPQAIRASLSAATLIPGAKERDISHLNNLLGRDEKYPLRPDYFANGYESTGPILRATCQLAEYLDEHGSLINYRRRRLATIDGALDETEWMELARSFGGFRNRSKELKFARFHLWQQLTGNLDHIAPREFAVTSPHRAAYDTFNRQLRPAQLLMLDQAAQRILDDNGWDEPITWEPPISLINTGDMPGRVCTPEEIDLIRSDAAANRAYGGTAGDLGISPLQVKLTLDLSRASAHTASTAPAYA